MSEAYEPQPPQYKVGDYVVLKRGQGFIRYIGPREHHHGTWYGIELAIGKGPSDGTEHGKRYFSCKPRHGIFVRLYAIKERVESTPAVRNRRPRPILRKHAKHLPALPQSTTVSENTGDTSTTHSSPSSYHHPPPPPPPQHPPLRIAQHMQMHRPQHQPPSVRAHRMTASSISSSSSSRAPPPVHSHYTLTLNRHLMPSPYAKSPRSRSPQLPSLGAWAKSAPRPKSTRAVAAQIDGRKNSSKHASRRSSRNSSRHEEQERSSPAFPAPSHNSQSLSSPAPSPKHVKATSCSPKTPSLTPTVKSSPPQHTMYTNPTPGHYKTDTVEIVMDGDHDGHEVRSMASVESSVDDSDMDDDVNDENEAQNTQLQPQATTNMKMSRAPRQRAHRGSRTRAFFPPSSNRSYGEGGEDDYDDADRRDRVVLPMARATTISVTEQIASVSNPRSRHHSRHSVADTPQSSRKPLKKGKEKKQEKRKQNKSSKNARCRSKSKPDADAKSAHHAVQVQPPLRYYYQQQPQAYHPQKQQHHQHLPLGRRRTEQPLPLRHSETETDRAAAAQPRIYRKQTQTSDGSTPPLPPPTQRAHSSQSPREFNPHMNEAEKLREIDRVKRYTLQRDRGEGFHKRQSRTVDFAFCENRELDEFARVRRAMTRHDSETSDSESDDSDDDDDDDVMKDIKSRQQERVLKQHQFQLPPLSTPQSPGKYTFRVHIKNTAKPTPRPKRISQRKSEPETSSSYQRSRTYELGGGGYVVDRDVDVQVRNEYAVQLAHDAQPVPLQVKQSFSISRSEDDTNAKRNMGPHLSLEIDDSNESAHEVAIVGYCGGAGGIASQSQKKAPHKHSNGSEATSASSNVMVSYDPTERVPLHVPHDSLAQIEQNKQGLLHTQNRWNLELLPDSDSENVAASQSKHMFATLAHAYENRSVSNATSKLSKHTRISKHSSMHSSKQQHSERSDKEQSSLLAASLEKSKSKSKTSSKTKQQQKEREEMKVDTLHCGDDILFIAQNNKHAQSAAAAAVAPREQRLFEIEDSVIEYHVPSRVKKKKSQNIKINIHINNDIVGSNKKKKSSGSHKVNKCVKASSSNSQQQHSHAQRALRGAGKGHTYSRSSMNGADDTIQLKLALSSSPPPPKQQHVVATSHNTKAKKKKKKRKTSKPSNCMKLKLSESEQMFYDNDDDDDVQDGNHAHVHRPLSARASNDREHCRHHHHHQHQQVFEITREKESKHKSSKRHCACQKHKRREERERSKLIDECVAASPRIKHKSGSKSKKERSEKKSKQPQQQQYVHQPQQIRFRSKTSKCLTPKHTTSAFKRGKHSAAMFDRPQFV